MPDGQTDSPGLVALRGVGMRFRERRVLHDISLSVRPGEILTLIGPNGAGKTTLARIVLGLLKPTEGSVRRAEGLTVGYVPQRLSVDPVLPMSVARLMSLPRPAPGEATRRSLAEVGAEHLLDREVQTLSGGEMQRVLLARALIREPALLVLDEPTQNVDYAGQADLYELIRRIRDRHGCGVMLVSHDLHVVMAATDSVLCLNGHVCCAGTPEAVSEHPEYQALFGAQGSRSVAVYRHDHAHAHTLSGEVAPLEDGCGHDHGHSHGPDGGRGDA